MYTDLHPPLLFQDEPYMKPGLAMLPNAVVVPHIASASQVKTTERDVFRW